MKTTKLTPAVIALIALTQFLLSSCSNYSHLASSVNMEKCTIGFHASYSFNNNTKSIKSHSACLTVNGLKFIPVDFTQQNTKSEFKMEMTGRVSTSKTNSQHLFMRAF